WEVKKRVRQPGEVVFHPMMTSEYNLPDGVQYNLPPQLGVRPVYKEFACGACGSRTVGRVLCDLIRKSDGTMVSWCVCSCETQEPTTIIEMDTEMVSQLPTARHFHAGPAWPHDLATL